VSVGYGTNSPGQKLSYPQTQNYWYHWLMATPRGEALVHDDRRAFTRHIWNEWFAAYQPDAAEFERTAAAFDNPDWAAVVVHSYRVRWNHAAADPHFAELERRFDPAPQQEVPTLTLHGALDPVNAPSSSEGKQAFFAGPYERRLIDGAGHFPQRERSAETVRHLLDWLRRHP
jgi:pimeloyl-ACP methyl ester carboxylesterase